LVACLCCLDILQSLLLRSDHSQLPGMTCSCTPALLLLWPGAQGHGACGRAAAAVRLLGV
jgi:hypothetical protein